MKVPLRILLGVSAAIVLANVTARAQDDTMFTVSDIDYVSTEYVSTGGGCSAEGNCDCGECGEKSSCEACGECGGAGCGSCCCLLNWCVGGEPWELIGETCCGIKVGGWLQAGYTNKNDGRFNSHPGRLHLHQGWLFAEKEADGRCGWDWGFRTDLLYGVDAQDTQAYGNDPGTWDYRNGWDHGIYGWAWPQLYGVLANGDLSVKIGHFFTPLGYEVVAAPQNFFYSHALTRYFSEPFTHTGVLASYAATDNLDVHAGWTLGWDTGFDQFEDGSNFLGGFSYTMADAVTFTYLTTAGNLGWRSDGYAHSIVIDAALTERLTYVIVSDVVLTNGVFDDVGNQSVYYPGVANDEVSFAQYLLYDLNTCWAVGGRLEWWKTDGQSVNEATFGLNWKPTPNLVVRPDVRYTWAPADEWDQTTLGIDGVFTF